MARLAMGIDVGLSGVRAAVVDEAGRLVGRARRPLESARMGDGVAEHDPREWIACAGAAAREAGVAAREAGVAARGAGAGGGDVLEDVVAVGVGALGPAPLLVDEGLEPLTPALLFSLDRRAEAQRHRLTSGLPAGDAAATLDSALPKLAWWAEHDPAVAGRAAWALDATGFVVASLTGVPTMDSVTAGDYRLPGVEPPFPLPDPVDPAAVAGELTAEAARELGLRPGLPVIAGTYDSFVDLAGAGVRAPGDAGLVLGSTMIIARAVERAEPVDGLGAAHYPGDGMLLGGWTLSGGLVLDWAARTLGGDVAELSSQAGEPAARRLLALPFLAGERTPVWDESARAAIVGMTGSTGAGDVFAAFVDSLALVVRDHVERLEAELGPCPSWRVTGGGARNRAWLEATAAAAGAPLEVMPDAGEAVGPALLALRALGIDPAREPAERVEPDPDAAARYEDLLPPFRSLRDALSDVLAALPNGPEGPEGTARPEARAEAAR